MTCPECRREVADLEELRATFAALPDRATTPLVRHRVRASILRDANRYLTRAPGSRRAMLSAVALLITAAGIIVFWRRPDRTAVVPSASTIASGLTADGVARPRFDVRAETGARWSTRARGSTTVIALEDGRASFEVAHLESGQRFLVALPDGEVEVRGTKFTVDVAMGATTTVEVASGRVALRLNGHEEIALGAGDRWRAPVSDDATQADAGRREPAASGAPPRVAATAPHATDAGEQFDAAMRRFVAGEYTDADRQLAAFIREHPADARCEDAAFLRAVARSRLGDRDAAAVLAGKYLRAYPHGLRRAEAQQLVDAGLQ